MRKIFISHSSDDKELVSHVIDLLEDIGVKTECIFCSSFEGYGIELGNNFLDAIRNNLTKETMVLFVLSTSFYNSHMCQCELGAVWVNTLQHIPVLVPPLSYNDLEYILRNQQSMLINDSSKVESLYESILKWMDLPQLKPSIWRLRKDRFLGNVDSVLKKNNAI